MKKINDKTYNWYKWHKACIIYDPNATSGSTTCKLVEQGSSGTNDQNIEQPETNTRNEQQV